MIRGTPGKKTVGHICNSLVLFVQIRSKYLKAEHSSQHSVVDFQMLKL